MNHVRHLAIAACLTQLVTLHVFAQAGGASSKFHGAVYKDPIPEQYIVVLNDTLSASQVPAVAAELASAHGGRLHAVWRGAIKGFAIALPEIAARALSYDPRVSYVEQNALVKLAATQYPAPWHLDRIDQTTGLNFMYHYCSTGRMGVYVIDTGIWADHAQLTGRVTIGVDFAPAANPPDGSTQTNPCSGTDNYNANHGTGVASVIAGTDWGVAKSAWVVPVRVFNCQAIGTIWGIVNGVDWVFNDFNNPTGLGGGQIANMSFGIGLNDPLLQGAQGLNAFETSVQSLINTGVTVVAAAGNNNDNASNYTPARMADVVTVGGTDENDARWMCTTAPGPDQCTGCEPGSNWGPAVKIFAPAHNVHAAHILTSTAERAATFPPPYIACNARTGTSFAAPIVAGVLARRMSEVGYLDPVNATAWLYTNGGGSNDNIVPDDGHGSPHRFVYKDAGGVCSP